MDASREMLEKQLEVMFNELIVAESEEEKKSIVNRIDTFYKLHQSDLEFDKEVAEAKEQKKLPNRIVEGLKFGAPYIFGGVVFIVGLVFEQTGSLTSKAFKETRDKFFPRA